VPVTDNADLPHLENALLWPLGDFREWARNAMRVIREIRSSDPSSGDLAWRALAADKPDAAEISPSTLLEKLGEQIAADLLKRKEVADGGYISNPFKRVSLRFAR
jgi:hypothetical protein